ncbi:DNA translocase FtsK 4TM domain-containing protein [Rhodocaloribacter sp.]
MAKTARKKKKGHASGKQSRPALVSPQRKKEVLGLILMVLALLLTLAIVTYSPADDAVARQFSLDALLNPGDNRAENALGLIGAAIARLIVPRALGYSALIFPALLFAWGYVFFRNRTPVYLPLLTILLSVSAFILSAFFGWFGLTLEVDLLNWSGAWGLGAAGWMQRVFGAAGSFILTLLTLVVTVLLVVDHDIQRSIDRVEEIVKTSRERLKTWRDGRRGQRAERRAERQRMLEERRAERARAEAERARKKKAEPRRPARTAPRTPERAVAPAPPSSRAPIPPEPVSPEPVSPEPEARPAPRPRAPAPVETAEPPQLELKVRARIEEEKTDALDVKVDDELEEAPFEMPPLDLLDAADERDVKIDYDELEENKQILLDKLATYNIEITDINAIVGPTVTLYELTPASGVKISRITALEDDLAMAMAARGIRMIAPIPGKTAIGVEIPNHHRELVRIRDVIGTARFRDADFELPLIIGKTIEGEVFIQDLTKMPHILIAGATGSGKSVGVNAFITGLLYACPPSLLKFVMIDPKKIELQAYARIMDHFAAMPPGVDEPIITDFGQALSTLKSCEKEMELRYDRLSKARVRSLAEYNKRIREGRLSPEDGHTPLPYVVVVVDELADLMMTAGKDIEGPIARLAQMARAVGIHLILATQRPSVDVITGLIKANFPARIAFKVATKIDSRTIIDRNGAEGLVGNGDLLFMLGSRLMRLQGPFVSMEEVDRLTHFIGEQPGAGPYLLPDLEESPDAPGVTASTEERDDLFEEAARIIVRSGQGSVSLLQRKLSVGYSRAARIVDQLEDAGIVGPFEGSKARQVLVDDEFQLDELLRSKP